MLSFAEQDSVSSDIIYRTNNLPSALKFLLNIIREQLPLARINILCAARDFSVCLPVADTMPIDYGIVRRQPGGAPPLPFPERVDEPCVIGDLSEHRDVFERLLSNPNVPLLKYASLLRLPLFSTAEHIFLMHFFSDRDHAFRVDHIQPLKKLLTNLQEGLQETFGVGGIVEAKKDSRSKVEALKLCPSMADVLTSVGNVAPTMATTLITGETGVGKEMVAEAVHELSPRAKAPLIKVNCGAIPENLIDSELFGHERGSFTGAYATRKGYFEMASGGSLFLDEIGELSLASQVRLLRVLDNGSYYRVGNPNPMKADARIIAATNRDLGALVREGKFRKDLYFRLAVYPIHIPPLRERQPDILRLSYYFLKNKMEKNGIYMLPKISAAEQKKLLEHSWPGNIRELEFVIERSLIDSRSGKKMGNLSFNIIKNMDGTESGNDITANWPPLSELTTRYIDLVLKKTGGRLSGPNGAARVLGIHYTTLCSHLKKRGFMAGHQTAPEKGDSK